MLDFFNSPEAQEQFSLFLELLPGDVWDTVYSTALATLFAYVVGLPLGILLVTGEAGGVRPLPRWFMAALNFVINILRSVPFLILMILAIPLSRLILGTSVGTAAMIPPLVIAAFPFVARMVESSLREVDRGVLEAATAINYGYYRTQIVLEYCAVIALVILVQIVQTAGTRTAVGSDKRLTKKSRRRGLRDANRQVNRDRRSPGGM